MSLALLNVGGVVAIGFDSSGRYMLVVSHSGRGVFDTRTWLRVARDPALAYPDDGMADGIGPLDGQRLSISEIKDDGTLQMMSPQGDVTISYAEGIIKVRPAGESSER